MKKEWLSELSNILQTKHVTFVCTANTCRSPMAEGLLKHALQRAPEPLRSVRVVSCGMNAEEGSPAHDDAVFAMKEKHIDISAHRSRNISRAIVADSLAIFTMRHGYIERLQCLYPAEMPADAYLMRELLPPPENGGIFDPYDEDLDEYVRCRDYMAEAIPVIVLFLSCKIMSVLLQDATEERTFKEFAHITGRMRLWRRE
jgi:protein-tyrosine-phosphatase